MQEFYKVEKRKKKNQTVKTLHIWQFFQIWRIMVTLNMVPPSSTCCIWFSYFFLLISCRESAGWIQKQFHSSEGNNYSRNSSKLLLNANSPAWDVKTPVHTVFVLGHGEHKHSNPNKPVVQTCFGISVFPLSCFPDFCCCFFFLPLCQSFCFWRETRVDNTDRQTELAQFTTSLRGLHGNKGSPLAQTVGLVKSQYCREIRFSELTIAAGSTPSTA